MFRSVLVVVVCMLMLASSVFAQKGDDEVRMSIFFGGGSYEVDKIQASDLINWLDSIPDLLRNYEIQLISHTDTIGGRAYNEWLSEMRSNTVQQLIIQNNHIPEERIKIRNWGMDNPVYRNDTYLGLRMNRRVDVILYPIIF